MLPHGKERELLNCVLPPARSPILARVSEPAGRFFLRGDWRLSVLPAFSPPRSDASALSEDAGAPLPCVSAWSCDHRPLSHGAVLVTSSPFLISDFSSPDFRRRERPHLPGVGQAVLRQPQHVASASRSTRRLLPYYRVPLTRTQRFSVDIVSDRKVEVLA